MKILSVPWLVMACLALIACTTPPILLDHEPDPFQCGQYPVVCGPAALRPCCPENNACTTHGGGCAYMGEPSPLSTLYSFDRTIEPRPRAIVREAFNDWERAIGVRFAEGEPAEIRVHLSDREPLDGMAIAGYERAGGVWIQERETLRNRSWLRALAVHEIGHAMGLRHDADPASCMTARVNAGCADDGIPAVDVRSYRDSRGLP